MRRLPIYFLIDVSESMVGEPIEQVQEGIAAIINELKTDPYALETAWVSIIGFAGKSKVITPLQDVISFYPPQLPIGSGTSLSSGLIKLMNSLDREVAKNTIERKGDWKPIVFLFTDGIPTDDTESEIARWNADYRKKTNMVVISIGENTNYNLLGKLTDHVLQFNNTDKNSYKDFFKWVTASIKSTSEKINNTSTDGINLSKMNSEVIEKIDLSQKHIIPNDSFVVLNGKCSNTNKLYLIKYKLSLENSDIVNYQGQVFKIQGTFEIDEKAYSEYSDENSYSLKVSSEELYGLAANCPCCANKITNAYCNLCGNIHCISGLGVATCPWCGNVGDYRYRDYGFDINRTLG